MLKANFNTWTFTQRAGVNLSVTKLFFLKILKIYDVLKPVFNVVSLFPSPQKS